MAILGGSIKIIKKFDRFLDPENDPLFGAQKQLRFEIFYHSHCFSVSFLGPKNGPKWAKDTILGVLTPQNRPKRPPLPGGSPGGVPDPPKIDPFLGGVQDPPKKTPPGGGVQGGVPDPPFRPPFFGGFWGLPPEIDPPGGVQTPPSFGGSSPPLGGVPGGAPDPPFRGLQADFRPQKPKISHKTLPKKGV